METIGYFKPWLIYAVVIRLISWFFHRVVLSVKNMIDGIFGISPDATMIASIVVAIVLIYTASFFAFKIVVENLIVKKLTKG